MNSLKRLIRHLSGYTVFRDDLYLLHESSRLPEIIGLSAHFGVGRQRLRVVSGGKKYVIEGGRIVSFQQGGVFMRLNALILGRILFARWSPHAEFLQKILYKKIFIVDLLSPYRHGMWRSALAFSAKTQHAVVNVDRLIGAASILVLGTGPSADALLNGDTIEAGEVIVACNSAVKSEELFRRRKVKYVCVSDATFYLGPSAYSRRWQADLVARARDFDFRLVCDFEHADFLTRLLEQGGADSRRIFPVKLSPFVRLRSRFCGRAIQHLSTNVFTTLMLPLAASLSRNIDFLGFDGKAPSVNYYWKHSHILQYTEDLGAVKEANPGFFDSVDFQRYNDQHADNVARMLGELASAGYRLRTLAPSFNSAFQKFYSQEWSVARDGSD